MFRERDRTAGVRKPHFWCLVLVVKKPGMHAPSMDFSMIRSVARSRALAPVAAALGAGGRARGTRVAWAVAVGDW